MTTSREMIKGQFLGASILIADDEEAGATLLRSILQSSGYQHVTAISDARQVSQCYQKLRPDLLLLDLHMPHLDGFQVMAALKPLIPKDSYFPILMLTADTRSEVKRRALAGGVKDFLSKPFDADEVRLRIGNLLETRYFQQQLQKHNEQLEQRVKERTRQLERTQVEMLVRLAHAAEYRDDETGGHVWRVASTSARLAREIGLPVEHTTLLLRAARLHDVGKIGIPDGILLKPSKLTSQEFEVIKTHTTIGAKLLSGGQSPLIKMAELIALTHHERWDGQGYPQGLKGEQIPIESRILAVADTFDALTHDRAHQRASSVTEAISVITMEAGRQFDPQVVEAFLRLDVKGELITSFETL